MSTQKSKKKKKEGRKWENLKLIHKFNHLISKFRAQKIFKKDFLIIKMLSLSQHICIFIKHLIFCEKRKSNNWVPRSKQQEIEGKVFLVCAFPPLLCFYHGPLLSCVCVYIYKVSFYFIDFNIDNRRWRVREKENVSFSN